MRLNTKALVLSVTLISTGIQVSTAAPVPDDFPRFVVPGHEKEMDSLRALFWLHYEPAGPLIPLWDEWMPMSTLWPARGTNLNGMRQRWGRALLGRTLNSEGYVLTEQHDGPAHAEGWPFPRWMEAGGVGWHFRGTGIAGYDAPLCNPQGWELQNAQGTNVSEKGWVVELAGARASLKSPPFSISAKAAPWLRLNWWAADLAGASCFVEWTTATEPDFAPERRAYFAPADSSGQAHRALPMGPNQAVELSAKVGETRTMIPVYRIPGWKGTITSLRLQFDNAGPGSIVIKSFHTACDTRQTINNTTFIRGSHDYFMWTHDISFLRRQAGRMRTAMRYMMNEFETRNRRCMYTTWPGHEGRSGVRIGPDGKKLVLPGEGIGGNYWDLLPFGGEDALASVYYYDAVLALAQLEEEIGRHAQWCVAQGAEAFQPDELRDHAHAVREYGQKRFWNENTGRFGTVDLDGAMHDYGFTFLNNEAIYYGFATSGQARSIRDWISGRRIVVGDTSTGTDIYRWRFGPRSTTRRNVDYYFWGWSAPESIPWGYQVQDGGAVLGFSYHDLMARLQVAGPDDAWSRLQEILTWFDETQAAGGYREYYKDASRGTMQGGNVPGGLGLDKEFFESIMVPQAMIYGFLGMQPTVEGAAFNPQLPSSWPELSVTRVHLHNRVLDIRVKGRTVTLRPSAGAGDAASTSGQDPLRIRLPEAWSLDALPDLARGPRQS